MLIKATEALIAWNGANDGCERSPQDAPWGAIAVGPLLSDDDYQIVYVYGVRPYAAHRAFPAIAEYRNIIKEMGCGPDKDEPGHDPNVGYGRVCLYPIPELNIFMRHGARVKLEPRQQCPQRSLCTIRQLKTQCVRLAYLLHVGNPDSHRSGQAVI